MRDLKAVMSRDPRIGVDIDCVLQELSFGKVVVTDCMIDLYTRSKILREVPNHGDCCDYSPEYSGGVLPLSATE